MKEFDLTVELDKILAGTKGLHISSSKRVVPFEDADPLLQIRWFKARVQELERFYTPPPKVKTATPAAT